MLYNGNMDNKGKEKRTKVIIEEALKWKLKGIAAKQMKTLQQVVNEALEEKIRKDS
jgi:hypothetical protein